MTDIDVARAELLDRGVDVGEIFHDTGGVFHHAGTEERAAGPAPDRASYGSFASSATRTAMAGCCRRSRHAFRAVDETGGFIDGRCDAGRFAAQQ